jgi:DNA-binding GntR family transcriptional regulator
MGTSLYELIRSDIIAGVYRPGEPLGETALATKYGKSRTPIREALQRLQDERLIERTTRGVQVRVSTPEEILDIYEVRITLEGAAARSAATRHTDLDLVTLRRAHEAMTAYTGTSGSERAELNRVFHEAIWTASHSPTLLDLLIRLNTHLIRYPTSTLTHGERWERVLVEHLELMDAIENRDSETARRLAEAHMSGARDVRLQMYGATP